MRAVRCTIHARLCGPLSLGRWIRASLWLLLLSLTACNARGTPTLFVPPTSDVVLATASSAASDVTPSPSATASPSATPITPTATPCKNDLTFVQDLTVPDGTSVTPGEAVDKQWLVTNTGSCSWDAAYRLKLITGDAMGASPELALFPARAGTQATLRIVFTAPQTAGNYSSAWQAVGPDGTAFGQAVYLQINVTP